MEEEESNNNNNNLCDEFGDDDDDDDECCIDDDDENNCNYFFPICCRDTQDKTLSFPTLREAIHHDVEMNQFDILKFLSANDDSFFETAIICINKCRAFIQDLGDVKNNKNVGSKLTAHLQATSDHNNNDDEKFFKPVLQDDAVLMCLDELQSLVLLDSKKKTNTTTIENSSRNENNNSGEEEEEKDTIVASLNMQLLAVKEQLQLAKSCITSLTNDDPTTTNEDSHQKGKSTSSTVDDKNDGYYFDSYSHHSIHESMLKDSVRTSAYEQAIRSNAKRLFEGKRVLDIGCGTGVLAIFCAQAGASQVIAIDNSDIISQAQSIITANGYGDVITCVKGKVEDLIANDDALPFLDEGNNKKIDVIVSEWMGYALFFETMLPSVLVSRDKLMDPSSGTMYPNGATIFLEGANDDERLSYWDNVHGIDMSSMKERVGKELCSEASVEIVEQDKIVTNRYELIGYNLNECKDDELDFEVPFELKPKKGGEATTTIHKLVISFDIAFDVPNTNAVHFSTGCQSEPTHWKQTCVWFDDAPLLLFNSEILRGKFNMTRNVENPREMDIHILWEVGNKTNDEEEVFSRRCNGWIVSKVKA